MSHSPRITCLTGAGTAPELMAEAVLARDAVARLHGLSIDEVHAPFGGVAVARGGQSFPSSTRDAVLDSDAVLVAGAEEPALDDVMAELDLRARVTRVRFGRHDDVAFVAPLGEEASEWALEAAFAIAEGRSMQLAVVGDTGWNELADEIGDAHDHVHVEHLSPRVALPLAAFNTSRFDARVQRARTRRLPACAAQRRVLPGGRMKMTGADAILGSLEAEGVEVMFGLPGGAILPLYDAMARGTTVRHVLARHEQGAGHMAEGYARASGRVGVAVATSGPGATNLVTPIADAWMDSTPLVCITGQVRSFLIGTDAFQECDITGITIPIVKHSWLVQDVEELPHVIKAAFHVASTGRCGPVLVDVPRDVQEAEFEFSYPAEVTLPGWKPPRRGNARQIVAGATSVAAAERPILYVGGGVLNAHATDELLALAEAARLPVVTTLMAKGAFPETHELHVGHPGMHGKKWSNFALNKADVVIAVGSRFDDRVTGKVSAFAPGATVVHFDIDAAEVGKIRHADIPVVGPLKLALAHLATEVRAAAADGAPDRSPWLRQLEEWRAQFPFRYQKADGVLKPQTAVEALRDLAATREEDVIWTTGVGQHQMWAMKYIQCDKPRSFITSGGLGTMGYGLPAAIGAKAARPDATVICIDCDR